MASLRRTPGGSYLVCFRFGGRQCQRSLKTCDPAAAQATRGRIQETLHLLHTHRLEVPSQVDAIDFIVSGGRLQTPVSMPPAPPTLKELVADYLANQFHKADSSRETESIHLTHLVRQLNEKALIPCDQISRADLVNHLQQRSTIRSGATVLKERMTIVALFRWAVDQGFLPTSPADRLPRTKGKIDREQFRTTGEIEALLARGGLDEEEQLRLWKTLYLSPCEISQLLRDVRAAAKSNLPRLLHAIAAYTGMRRGEILRLRWVDIDFEHASITARSRKQSRQTLETTRSINLHPELKTILAAHRDAQITGQFVVSQDGEALGVSAADWWFRQPLRETHWCLDADRNRYKVGFHTLRHSFASNLAALGVDQRIIDSFMGHQTEAMRKRYQHLFPKLRRSAIESISYSSTITMSPQDMLVRHAAALVDRAGRCCEGSPPCCAIWANQAIRDNDPSSAESSA